MTEVHWYAKGASQQLQFSLDTPHYNFVSNNLDRYAFPLVIHHRLTADESGVGKAKCHCCFTRFTHGLSSIRSSAGRVMGNQGSKTGKEKFPGGPVVKNFPENTGDMRSTPGLGRSHILSGHNYRSPKTLEPWSHNKRRHCSEKPLLSTTGESPHTAPKAQSSQRKKKKAALYWKWNKKQAK